MDQRLRNSGISIVGSIPQGTHICVFYQTKEDLLEILVPYFAAGLASNESCVWVVSDPLTITEAKSALNKEVEDLDAYYAKGQIRIVNATDWYTPDGTFDAKKLLKNWVERESHILSRGFDGLRVSGNLAGLDPADWDKLIRYEAVVNDRIGQRPVIAVCAYPVDHLMISQILDTATCHQFVLRKRKNKWDLVKSTVYKTLRSELAGSGHLAQKTQFRA